MLAASAVECGKVTVWYPPVCSVCPLTPLGQWTELVLAHAVVYDRAEPIPQGRGVSMCITLLLHAASEMIWPACERQDRYTCVKSERCTLLMTHRCERLVISQTRSMES